MSIVYSLSYHCYIVKNILCLQVGTHFVNSPEQIHFPLKIHDFTSSYNPGHILLGPVSPFTVVLIAQSSAFQSTLRAGAGDGGENAFCQEEVDRECFL